MFCEKCGTEIPYGSHFCSNCGNKVQPSPFDQNNTTNAQYQNAQPQQNYGYAQTNPYQQNNYASPTYNQQLSKKPVNKKLIAIIVSLGLAVVVAVTAVIIIKKATDRSTPERALQQFISAMKDKDFESAVECLPPTVQALYKGYANAAESWIGALGVDFDLNEEMEKYAFDDDKTWDYIILGTEYKNDNLAYVTIRSASDSGAKVRSIPMGKNSGKWYIDFDQLFRDSLADSLDNLFDSDAESAIFDALSSLY